MTPIGYGCFEINTEPADFACFQNSDCTTQVIAAVVCDDGTCDTGPVNSINTAGAARIAQVVSSLSTSCDLLVPGQDSGFGAVCVNGSCSINTPDAG